MDSAPALPTKFPCWCRAIYSWGGESKRDLGFVEGDLIECLNAGDGQWWTGRLRRDKRAVGMFPSNFVKVLGEDFKPVSRGTSPQVATESEAATPPKKEKSVFRKPFQAYSAALPESKKPDAPVVKAVKPISRAGHERNGSAQREARSSRVNQLRDTPSRQDSGRSYVTDASHKHFSYQQSPHMSRENSRQSHAHSHSQSQSYQSYQASSRRESYQPYDDAPGRQNSFQQHGDMYGQDLPPVERRNSYAPPPNDIYNSYTTTFSPEATPPPPPPQHHSRAQSPLPPTHQDDEPPPPPPPHRVTYSSKPSRAPSPAMNDRYPAISRTPSPMPHSPNPGMTPSPLRDAMDDVHDMLQGMTTAMGHRQDDPETPEDEKEPLNPWSPEAFEEFRTKPTRNNANRPQSSMVVGGNGSYTNDHNVGNDSGYSSNNSTDSWKERMESRLRSNTTSEYSSSNNVSSNFQGMAPSAPKHFAEDPRPMSSGNDLRPASTMSFAANPDEARKKLRSRKSAYELGKEMIGRTFTTKSSNSNATQSTNTNSNSSGVSNHTLMSGQSAGAFSATSAGSFARRTLGSIRRQNRPNSVAATRPERELDTSQMYNRPPSEASGPSYHASHSSQNSSARPVSAMARPAWASSVGTAGNPLGGLAQASASNGQLPQLKSKRSGFLRKLVDSAKTVNASAKTAAATARNTIASSPTKERRKSILPTGIPVASSGGDLAAEMGLGGGVDWMQFRRDVNRSNSLSSVERGERQEKCEMMGQPVIPAVDLLAESAEGDESHDGMPVTNPTDFKALNMQLVDKAARFVTNLPPMTNPISLAQGYLCRPYRSDVQRLRAIFTWVSEKIAWEEDYDGEVDARRVIQSRRGCAAEVAMLVFELCEAAGLQAETINGFLKPPGEIVDIDKVPRPNHWWNAVLVDGQWRIMDCSLASPTNPKRSRYSMASTQAADSWYFLMRPLEACYTHIPSHMSQQHLVPAVAPYILMALPCACPPFFRHGLQLADYDTSLLYLTDLDVMQLDISVPSDVDLHAEVETRAYARDPDGDTYESGENVVKRALAQAQWENGKKRYTVKAVLPGDEGYGKLKIYAGKRGLMHSVKDNPHSLALSLPMVHQGQNPPYDFFIRHPSPHAQRNDLYIAQPQCYQLACGNTFVFAVRQHPSSISSQGGNPGCYAPNASYSGALSPLPFRPGSAMSMASSSASGSQFGPTATPSTYSSSSSGAGAGEKREKAAKLAVQTPSGKILKLSRKTGDVDGEFGGCSHEAYIKVGERGTWRGLVLADRSARWCVFGEWECV